MIQNFRPVTGIMQYFIEKYVLQRLLNVARMQLLLSSQLLYLFLPPHSGI